MKTLLLLFLSAISYSQTYNIELIGSGAFATKYKGTLEITETKCNLVFDGKVVSYDVVKNVNGIVYITDGVMTDWLQIVKSDGKKKGVDYNYMIYLNYDQRKNLNVQTIYYCKWQP